MEFPGLVAADLADAYSLNRAFLRLLAEPAGGQDLRAPLPQAVRRMLRGCQGARLDRLAEAPFLLLSLREEDTALWQVVLSSDGHGDLFAAPASALEPRQRLYLASLACAWQLARHHTYAARIFLGAPKHWCELVAQCPLARFLDSAGRRGDVMLPRFAETPSVWVRLLCGGTSDDPGVRRAAHVSALQAILTRVGTSRAAPLRSAACDRRDPVTMRSASSRGT